MPLALAKAADFHTFITGAAAASGRTAGGALIIHPKIASSIIFRAKSDF